MVQVLFFGPHKFFPFQGQHLPVVNGNFGSVVPLDGTVGSNLGESRTGRAIVGRSPIEMVLESGDRFEDSRAMGGGNASSMPHQAQPWIVSVGNQRFVFNTHNSKLIIAEAVGRATALSYNDRQNEANSMFH